jgi:hypothetical protein
LVAIILLVYVAGASVRSRSGIRIAIQNTSGSTLENVVVKLENKPPYIVGKISSGYTRNIFLLPGAESNIRLDFNDSSGARHTAIIAGYVESGYCGEINTQILPGLKIESRDQSFAEWNWKSWYGFL